MPILYLVGLVYSVLLYSSTKWAILHLHPKPPQYSYKLVTSTLGWAPWMVLCHLCIAFWGYSIAPGYPADFTYPPSTNWSAPYDLPPSTRSRLFGVDFSHVDRYVWLCVAHINASVSRLLSP